MESVVRGIMRTLKDAVGFSGVRRKKQIDGALNKADPPKKKPKKTSSLKSTLRSSKV